MAARRSVANATAMQPLPVPTSAMRQRPCRIRETLERGLDDELGLGARDEHRWRDDEVEPPEFADSGDVGDWFASFAAGRHGLEARGRFGACRLVAPREPCRAIPSSRRAREHFGVDGRLIGWNARANETFAGRDGQKPEGQGTADYRI